MSKRPLVSVITPCFRTEKYLQVFLNHLPQQTIFKQTQFVLDMNAPSRLEIQIASDFQKSYPDQVKVLYSNEVANISTSMNRALHNSDSDFVAIWNIDDLRTNSSLENQYQKLQELGKNSFTIDSFEIVGKFGQESGRLVMHENLTQEDLLSGMYLGPFFMFSKELVDEIGYFDEQLFSGADFDFAIRLARAAEPVYPPGLAGYYLDEGMGASTRPNSLQALERTVIELRYGIFHKIDPRLVYRASQYVIPSLLKGDQYVELSVLFKGYTEYISDKLARFDIDKNENLHRRIRRKILSGWNNFKRIVGFGRWH
jgi:glycosyltransferase involved in cell wall biosynthesis